MSVLGAVEEKTTALPMKPLGSSAKLLPSHWAGQALGTGREAGWQPGLSEPWRNVA